MASVIQWRIAALLSLSLLAPQPSAQSPQQSPQPAPPTFRGRVTLVPIEVRVIDKKGKPVTDLTQADFTISENGKPQEIRHFLPIALSADTAPARAQPATAQDPDSAPVLTPQKRRVFLIVLGHGNLQVPSKGIDGALHLVRDLLLPQDVVAVTAWNRATDFTTNHDQITAMLERYKTGHPLIENELSQAWSGLAAIYGTGEIPKAIQSQIDASLKGGDGPALRTVTTEAIPLPELFGSDATPPDVTLDDYLKNAGQASDDLARVYAGINYLRHVDGEKHLWFISPHGLPRLTTKEDDRRLAAAANDARVVIDLFNSGGIGGGGGGGIGFAMDRGTLVIPGNDSGSSSGGRDAGQPAGGLIASSSLAANRLPTINIQSQFNPRLGAGFDISAAENVAEWTGGQFTGLSYGSEFADRIDVATRSGYQLGYYSSNPQFDGKYRQISVKVKGRGLTVLYRHGYYAREAAPPLDRRQVLSANRVLSAARYTAEVHDLGIGVTAESAKTPKGDRQMSVQIFLEPSGVIPSDLFGRHQASLDVAVFCGDKNENIVGRTWDQVEVRLNEDQYSRFQRGGVTFSVKVPIKAAAKFVKVVVYDYTTDKVGTTMVTIK